MGFDWCEITSSSGARLEMRCIGISTDKRNWSRQRYFFTCLQSSLRQIPITWITVPHPQERDICFVLWNATERVSCPLNTKYHFQIQWSILRTITVHYHWNKDPVVSVHIQQSFALWSAKCEVPRKTGRNSLLAVLMVMPVLDISSKVHHSELSLIFRPTKHLFECS